MDPIKITFAYNSEGGVSIQRAEASLNNIEHTLQRINTLGSQQSLNRAMRNLSTEASRAANEMSNRWGRAIGVVTAGLSSLESIIVSLARRGFYMFIAGVGATTAALTMLGKKFVEINEQFRGFEITLRSALRSTTLARQLRNEVAAITAKSPLPFQDIAEAVKAFAVIPYTRGQLMNQGISGTTGTANSFLARLVRVTEQLVAFRPDKSVADAVFAIRELMTGEQRSLIRRFDISPSMLSDAVGKSVLQIKRDPKLAFEAIEKAFSQIISPQAIAEFTRQPSIMLQNLIEQLLQRPFLAIGDAGLFDKVMDFLENIFKQANEFMDNRIEPMAKTLASSLGKMFEIVQGKLGSMMEWALSKVGAGVNDMPGMTPLDRTATAIERGISVMAEKLPSVLDSVGKFLAQLGPALAKLVEFAAKLAAFLADSFQNHPMATIGGVAMALQGNKILGLGLNSMATNMSAAWHTGEAGVMAKGTGSAVMGGVRNQMIRDMLAQASASSMAMADDSILAKRFLSAMGRFGKMPSSGFSSDELLKIFGQDPNAKAGISAAPKAGTFLPAAVGNRLKQMATLTAPSLDFSGLPVVPVAPTQGEILKGGLTSVGKTVGIYAGIGLAVGAWISALNSAGDAIKMFSDEALRQTQRMAGKLAGDSTFDTSPEYQGRVFRLSRMMGTPQAKTIDRQFNLNLPRLGMVYPTAGGMVAPMPQLGGIVQEANMVSPRDVMTRLSMARGDAHLIDSFFSGKKESISLSTGESFSMQDLPESRAKLLRDYRDRLVESVADIQRRFENFLIGSGVPRNTESSPAEQTKLKDLSNKISDFANPEYWLRRSLDKLATSNSPGAAALRRFEVVRGGLDKPQLGTDSASLLTGLEDDSRKLISPLAVVLKTRTEIAEKMQSNLKQLIEARSAMTEFRRSPEAGSLAVGDLSDVTSIWRQYSNPDLYGKRSTSFGGFPLPLYGDGRGLTSYSPGLMNWEGRVADSLESNYRRIQADLAEKQRTALLLGVDTTLEGVGKVPSASVEAAGFMRDLGRLGVKGFGASDLFKDSSLTNAADIEANMVKVFENWKKLISDAFAGMTDSPDVQKRIHDAAVATGATVMEQWPSVMKELNKQYLTQTQAQLFQSAGQRRTGDWDLMTGRLSMFGGGLSAEDDALLRLDTSKGRFLGTRVKQMSRLAELADAQAQASLSKYRQADLTRPEGRKQGEEYYSQFENYAKQADDLRRSIEELRGSGDILSSFRDGFQEITAAWKEAAFNFKSIGEDVAQSLRSNLGTAFSDFILGTKDAADAFRDFALSIMKDMVNILSNKIAEQILGYAFSGLGSWMKGGAGKGIDASGGTLNIFGDSGPLMAASGGHINRGSGIRDDVPALLMRGEYVMPRSAVEHYGVDVMEGMRRRSVPMMAEGGMAGALLTAGRGAAGNGVNVNVTVNIPVAQTKGSAQNVTPEMSAAIGRGIQTAVRNEVMKMCRPGGLLNAAGIKA